MRQYVCFKVEISTRAGMRAGLMLTYILFVVNSERPVCSDLSVCNWVCENDLASEQKIETVTVRKWITGIE